MRVDVLTPGELAAPELGRWAEIQASDAVLASPFLSPEFTAAVGRARRAARVAVLSDATGVVGFLPFERRRLRSAGALAMGLSDVQGVVAPPSAPLALHEVIGACGLRSFDFDHLLAGHARWLDGTFSHYERERSPAIDLSDGFDAYADRQRAVSRSLFQSTARKRRKLEREHGPVRFVFDERDPAVLEQLVRWKSAQYRRTGRVDRFARPANRALVHDLVERQHAGFAAPLSVLLAGDTVVAAHLGLRSASTLASWFPAYDRAYARYSPGLMLCLELARAMPDEGLTLLDLGKGEESYKERLCNVHIDLLRGSVARDRLSTRVHHAKRWPRDGLTKLVLESPRLRRQARATLAVIGRLRSMASPSAGLATASGPVAARAWPAPAADRPAISDRADEAHSTTAALDVVRPPRPHTTGELGREPRSRARSAWATEASRLSQLSGPAPETASARLAISALSLYCLGVGVVASAFGAQAPRVASLMCFCLVGIGSAPWQVNTRLRLPARLTMTMLTSTTMLTLGSLAMLAVGRWAPTLAFGVVVAACVPLHLVGVYLARRDSTQLRPARSRSPRAGARDADAWVPVTVAGTGAALCLGAALVHRVIDPGFFGLLTEVGPAWYVGLALVLIAVVLWPPGREYQDAIPVMVLALVLTLTPALVYGGPRSQSAGKHIDLVVQILTRHRLDTSVEVYDAWPGFFGATAWLCAVTGVRDPLHLATFWPALLALFRVAALRYLFGQILRSARQAWIAVALAVLADPIGADYFSPQSVAFVLALAVFALALERSSYVPRLSLIFVTGCVLAVSHQLTPYAVGAVLMVLVAFNLVRPWWTPMLVLAPALAWLIVHRTALEGFVSWDDIGAWGNLRPPRTTPSAGLERLPVVRVTVLALVLGIVVVGALALFALLRRRRDRSLWAFACCPLAGLVLVVINPYGQEGIFRATLFGLPWLAVLAAHAFSSMRRMDPGLALAAVLGVLTGTFLLASFGLDASNVVRPADLAAYRLVQQEAPASSAPSYVLSLGAGDLPSFLPPEADTYDAVARDELKLPAVFARLPPAQQLQQLTQRFLRFASETTDTAELYALWSPASSYHDWAYGVQSPREFAALRDAFRSSPDWELVLHRDGTYLFRLERSQVTTEAAGP